MTATIAGALLVALVLVDSFETLVSPRRVTRRLRPARLLFRVTWPPWRQIGLRIRLRKRREAWLSVFGPLSMLVLFTAWALGLVLGFALIHWGLALPLNFQAGHPGAFVSYFYLSGITMFTVGYGDVTPGSDIGRILLTFEAGLGLGFLATVIGYMPVLYQAFASREKTITMLDARAGSPPTAYEVLRRLGGSSRPHVLDDFLRQWEEWSADVLESHLSFPVLSYYRSQHDNQSWLAALTVTLDTCAILRAGVRGVDSYQARLTFAMARHAAIDLALIFGTPPVAIPVDRLPAARFAEFRKVVDFEDPDQALPAITELRALYEPYVNALSIRFLMELPPVASDGVKADNWQVSAWKHLR